ncbi:MAG: glycosyltransferase [Planctomycetaceae bacterium]|nr:glycosyltransferase [Planctomycetaceae bacterium]
MPTADRVPQVSVVIPVYNGGDYTALAIESALGQRDCDVEVIVVNDGSTDKTQEVLSSFGDAIIAINQPNQGIAKTRNRGIEAATSEWVAFLDNDDLWLPEKLSQQLQAAEATRAGAVYTNTMNFGAVERIDSLRHPDPASMPIGDLFEQLLMDNFFVTSSLMVKRDALNAVSRFSENPDLAEDWDLWLSLAAAGVRFAAVPDALTKYLWRSGSFSKNHERMRSLRMNTVRKALETDRGRSLPWTVRRQALANVERCSAWFLASSSPRKAIAWYMNSILHWPFDADPWKGIVKGCLGRC